MRFLGRWVSLVWLACVLAACGGGGSGSNATKSAPTAVIRATAAAANASGPALIAAVGSTVALDATGSSAANGSISGYTWTVSSKPAGSTATVTNPAAAQATFSPDVVGSYALALQIVDANGTPATATLGLTVTAAIPSSDIVTSVSFGDPSATKPVQGITIGSLVTLDGSASVDANAHALTLSWQLVALPVGSTAVIAASGPRASFSPDVVGVYKVRARGTDTTGAIAEVIYPFNANAAAPKVVVSTGVTSGSTSSTLSAATGDVVLLDGGDSFPSATSDNASWTLLNAPAGSSARLSATSGSATNFVPDLAGSYAAQFSLRDNSTGLATTHTVFVSVVDGPQAVVSADATPVAAANGPSFAVALNVPVTLRGDASHDVSGAALTYAWSIVSMPSGSAAVIDAPTASDVHFTPDVVGSYQFQLAVTSVAGLTTQQPLTVYVGNSPPVAAVDRPQVAVLVGNPAIASAAASFDQNNQPLTYSWSIDARPAGSTAAIVAPTTAALNFSPDVAGNYTATVTVSNGTFQSIAAVSLVALTATPGTVPLTYQPIMSAYSRSLDLAVIVAGSPNTLHLVSPSAATDTSIALPAVAKSVSVSADGTLAAVLYEGAASLVDLAAHTIVQTSSTAGSQTEVLVSNGGLIYALGQSNTQTAATPAFTVIDGRSGAQLQVASNYYYLFQGPVKGVLSTINQKLYTTASYSSGQISATTVDPVTGLIGGGAGNSQGYSYGNVTMLWLSRDESVVFSPSGAYYKASDLTYAGTLGVSVLSVSSSTTASEAVALQNASPSSNGQSAYPSVLKRFTGPLLFPADDVPLRQLGGVQTYGIAVFHRADDSRAVIVQTGSELSQGSGLQYDLIVQ